MVFSSMIFLWLFLPVVLAGSFLFRRQVNLFLLLASLLFYAWGEPVYVLLMILTIIVNWISGMLMDRFPKRKKTILALCLAVNLGLLGYFKYAGILVQSMNHILGGDVFAIPEIALPIGISFYTFQALSYVVDVYRGVCKTQKNILSLALYISFFPQLIAGPIVKYKDINDQILHRQVTEEKFVAGIRRFIYGLGKKVLLANVLALGADRLYALEPGAIPPGYVWLASVLYTFQIYYDFSGYSDMAIGLGKMFGFEFKENFNYPYLSLSIREFWRRWHISLSTWFRDYVYIPLGGNRKGNVRTYGNLMLVFLLTGIWHGAGYNFVLWGMYHGFFLLIERSGLDRVLDRHKVVSGIYTFLVVNFGWVLFRVEDLKSILLFLRQMLLPGITAGTAAMPSLWELISLHTVVALALSVLGMGLLQMMGRRLGLKQRWRGSLAETIYLGGLLLLCLASVAGNVYNPFIYFRF